MTLQVTLDRKTVLTAGSRNGIYTAGERPQRAPNSPSDAPSDAPRASCPQATGETARRSPLCQLRIHHTKPAKTVIKPC